MPITAFDRPTLRALRPAIEAALAPVAAAHGIRVRVGNARFTPTTVDLRLELVIDRPATADGAVPESKEAASFRRLAPLYDLRPDQLGALARIDGTLYRIVGLRPAAPKRPIVLAAVADPARRVVCGPELVRQSLVAA